MAKRTGNRPPSGEIRQSQVVTTFGPGSMVDLPNHSVVIGGLDHWHGDKKLIREERLERYICEQLDLEEVKMYTPPVDEQIPGGARTGITVFTFPLWFVAQVRDEDIKHLRRDDQKDIRTRPLVHWRQLINGQYFTADRKKRPVVPVRFVQACPNGHLSDIEWKTFAHRSSSKPCNGGQLWLDEGGSGGDLAQIFVRCEACGARRALSDAKTPKTHLPHP